MKANRNRQKRNQIIVILVTILILTGCSSPGEERNSTADPANESPTSMLFSENSTIYEIDPAESEARFLIDEILHGEEKTVVGKTSQISGQIAVDFADPSTAAAGPVQVNANTFETDNGFRNRAVQSRILLASIYQFINFTPTAVRELPEEIVIGEAVDFVIDGDLTITTITQPVTFVVTVIPLSESQLEGHATTTINRSDFNLVVPSATGVAAVAEEVILELDFVAEAAK